MNLARALSSSEDLSVIQCHAKLNLELNLNLIQLKLKGLKLHTAFQLLFSIKTHDTLNTEIPVPSVLCIKLILRSC